MTKFVLPKLPYDFGALEPYIDAITMEIHHDKHHATYVEKLNSALENPAFAKATADWEHPISIDQIIKNLDKLPEDIKTDIRNQGGGHLNHSMFWLIMKKNGGGNPKGKVSEAIKKSFESFDAFKEEFNNKAKTVFGSGWAWLVIDKNEQLKIVSSANQDNPISKGLEPILGLDVWEHAYYLKYQNKRPDYINAFWHVINWEQVEENYNKIFGR